MDLKHLMYLSNRKKMDDGPDSQKMKAKMKVIEDLKKMAQDLMGEDLVNGMQKVTVAAPDQDSLEQGLDKAKDIIEDKPMSDDHLMMDESDDEMAEEESEYQSPEELEAEIQKLMELKKKMMG